MARATFKWSVVAGILLLGVVILLVRPALVGQVVPVLATVSLPDLSHGGAFPVFGLLLLSVAVLLLVGLFAARESGRVLAGTLTGLIAVAISYALATGIAVFYLLMSPSWSLVPTTMRDDQYHNGLVGSVVQATTSHLVLALLTGLLAGSLGGVFGSRLYDPDKLYDPLLDPDLQPGALRALGRGRRFGNSVRR